MATATSHWTSVTTPHRRLSEGPARYINLDDWIQHSTCRKIVDGTASCFTLIYFFTSAKIPSLAARILQFILAQLVADQKRSF